MSEALVVFKAIEKESEKHVLFQKVLGRQETIYLRDKSDETVALKPMSLNSNLKIKCFFLEEASVQRFGSGRLTASVTIEGENYIFDTQLEVGETYINLPIFNLFHLQKRKNYRYILPEDYSAEFVINSLNQNQYSLRCRLLDLSTEGCAIQMEIENANLNIGDQIEGAVFLGTREAILIQGKIMNIRPKGVSHLVLGVEFDHMANSSEDKIVTSLADLQREVYFRRAG